MSFKLSVNYFWSNKHKIGYRWLEICCIVNNEIAFVINKFILIYHLPCIYTPKHIIN